MKLLFVMDQGIGNMVMATPSLRAIKLVQPDSHLTVFGKYPALEVIEGLDFIDAVTTECRDDDFYDHILASIWSNAFFKQYDKAWLQQHCRVCDLIQFNNPDRHESEYHMLLAEKVGYKGGMPAPMVASFDRAHSESSPFPEWTSMRQSVCMADTYLDETWKRKSWEGYPQLARLFQDAGFGVFLLGGERESKFYRPDSYPPNVVTCFNHPLWALPAILKQMQALIANDSGPAHIAAAVGTPTFTIFGATRWPKNKPLGKNSHVLRRQIGCSPCQYTDSWKMCKQYECMDIPPEFVFETVMDNIKGESK